MDLEHKGLFSVCLKLSLVIFHGRSNDLTDAAHLANLKQGLKLSFQNTVTI